MAKIETVSLERGEECVVVNAGDAQKWIAGGWSKPGEKKPDEKKPGEKKPDEKTENMRSVKVGPK